MLVFLEFICDECLNFDYFIFNERRNAKKIELSEFVNSAK